MTKFVTISKPDANTVLASARITGRMMVPGENRDELYAAMHRIESASTANQKSYDDMTNAEIEAQREAEGFYDE